MSLVQIKMHHGIIKKGGFFSLPSQQQFLNTNHLSLERNSSILTLCMLLWGTQHLLWDQHLKKTLQLWILQIAGTATHYFSGENIGDRVQCNKLKISHVRTKRCNRHSKPCGAPQKSNCTMDIGTFRRNHWKLFEWQKSHQAIPHWCTVLEAIIGSWIRHWSLVI